MFEQTTAIDLSGASPDEIDYILDYLYTEGYMAPMATTPSYYDMEDDYYDRFGTTPSFLVCYVDAEGDAVVEATDETSGRGQRLLADARKVSVARLSMMAR